MYSKRKMGTSEKGEKNLKLLFVLVIRGNGRPSMLIHQVILTLGKRIRTNISYMRPCIKDEENKEI